MKKSLQTMLGFHNDVNCRVRFCLSLVVALGYAREVHADAGEEAISWESAKLTDLTFCEKSIELLIPIADPSMRIPKHNYDWAKELEISPKQSTTIRSINDELRKAVVGNEARSKELIREFQVKCDDLLSEDQRQRLKQVTLQLYRLTPFSDPVIIRELGISKEQKAAMDKLQKQFLLDLEKIAPVYGETFGGMPAPKPGSAAERAQKKNIAERQRQEELALKKCDAAKRKHNEAVLKLLNKDQLTAWHELLGKPVPKSSTFRWHHFDEWYKVGE